MGNFVVQPEPGGCFEFAEEPSARLGDLEPHQLDVVLDIPEECALGILALCDLAVSEKAMDATKMLGAYDPPSLSVHLKKSLFRAGGNPGCLAAKVSDGCFVQIDNGGDEITIEGWLIYRHTDLTLNATVSRSELIAALDADRSPRTSVS